MRKFKSIEVCAGAGGQALGLEQAGFDHACLLEIDSYCCKTLKLNRPNWNVIQGDLNHFSFHSDEPIDLVSGGLPCPPFSVAGKQLGEDDERNLFPAAIRLIKEVKPRAVLIENVRGILDAVFEDYRKYVSQQLHNEGYETGWKLVNASDFGVPQLRPRVTFVALRREIWKYFTWPQATCDTPPTVGETLRDLMAVNGWRGVNQWVKRANEIAPTIVGGSLKHGGPDLGPTRAKRAWASLGVDGHNIAEEPPARNFVGMPRLTVRMVARLQGFPDEWAFAGRKTPAYRQVGNAFPPPVARAIGKQIYDCLIAADRHKRIRVAR